MSTSVRFFICGSALTGEPDHHVLEGARFLGPARTEPYYRMRSVDGRHPAVYRSSADGVALIGELYELSEEHHRRLLAQEPPLLYEDEIVLEDGSVARAMLFPTDLLEGRDDPDVSSYGSWSAFKQAGRAG